MGLVKNPHHYSNTIHVPNPEDILCPEFGTLNRSDPEITLLNYLHVIKICEFKLFYVQ